MSHLAHIEALSEHLWEKDSAEPKEEDQPSPFDLTPEEADAFARVARDRR